MNRINFASYIAINYSYWNGSMSRSWAWDRYIMIYRRLLNNLYYTYEKSDMC